MKEPWRPDAPSPYDYGLKSKSNYNTSNYDKTDCLTWREIIGVHNTKSIILADEIVSCKEDEPICYECDDRGCEECPRDPNKPGLNTMTLQDVLDLLPDGISPKNVRMHLNYDASAFAVEHCYFEFTYNKKLDLNVQKELYEADCRKYNEEILAPYLVEKERYDTWKIDKDITETEEKLAELRAIKQ